METRRLEAFRVLVEKGNFRLAAEALCISQPALSQQIGRLEQDFGARLIDRTLRPFGLTAAGKEVHVRIRRVLDEVRDLEDLLDGTRRGDVGRVTLGMVPSLLYGHIPSVVKRFTDRRPGVEVEIVYEPTTLLKDRLVSGRMDVGLLYTEPDIKGLTSRTLYSDPFVAAVNKDHRLAGERTISVAQLRGEPLISVPRAVAPESHDAVVAACMQAGFSPKRLDAPGSYLDHVGLTSAGLGISLIPASLNGLLMENVTYIPLVGPEVRAVVSVCWFGQRSDLAARLLVEHVIENCSNQLPPVPESSKTDAQ